LIRGELGIGGSGIGRSGRLIRRFSWGIGRNAGDPPASLPEQVILPGSTPVPLPVLNPPLLSVVALFSWFGALQRTLSLQVMQSFLFFSKRGLLTVVVIGLLIVKWTIFDHCSVLMQFVILQQD